MTDHRTADEIAALLARAEDFWRARGSRLTHVRRLACAEAFARLAPFPAADLLDAVRRRDRAVSSASIYRTLADLVAADVLRIVPGPADTRLHAVADQQAAGHAYLVCTDCSRAFPLEDPCLAMRGGPSVRRQGFQARAYTLRVEAACDELRTTGACAKRGASPAPAP